MLGDAFAADVISAVEFDSDGSYLATGDKGGRVVLFEKVSTQPVSRSNNQTTVGSENSCLECHVQFWASKVTCQAQPLCLQQAGSLLL